MLGETSAFMKLMGILSLVLWPKFSSFRLVLLVLAAICSLPILQLCDLVYVPTGPCSSRPQYSHVGLCKELGSFPEGQPVIFQDQCVMCERTAISWCGNYSQVAPWMSHTSVWEGMIALYHRAVSSVGCVGVAKVTFEGLEMCFQHLWQDEQWEQIGIPSWSAGWWESCHGKMGNVFILQSPPSAWPRVIWAAEVFGQCFCTGCSANTLKYNCAVLCPLNSRTSHFNSVLLPMWFIKVHWIISLFFNLSLKL